MDKNIVMLAQDGELTNVTYNLLAKDFDIERVVIELPEPRGKFVKRRMRRMGVLKVLGQILFQLTIVPVLRRSSRRRIAEIKTQYMLNDSPIDESKIFRVKSVNSKKSRQFLEELKPDVIVVVGTRIIAKRILEAVPVPFVNIHCGITPLYRGAHGAYWALVKRDLQACGVTVHLVDPGIDTGSIIEQALVEPAAEDNYYTYPYLQFGEGVPLIRTAVEDVFNDRLEQKPPPPGESALWSHPTFFEYIRNRIRLGVR